jgi:hypothetical protein
MTITDPDEIEEDGNVSGEGPWKFAQPSAQVIQKHYVNARVHELNRDADRHRDETVHALLKDYGAQIKWQTRAKKLKYCGLAYDMLTSVLQQRDLTINLNAAVWFSQPNPYKTYAHMYERAMKGGGPMELTDADELNPANQRAWADDRITFPEHWADKTSPAHRGLDPRATQSGQAISNRMLTGTAIPSSGTILAPKDVLQKTRRFEGPITARADTFQIDPLAVFTSKNPKLNPKAKQVFAALNYGRRTHGSSHQYGWSHLVLKANLKVDAIYFPGDTFYIPGADHQATFKTLGKLYLNAGVDLRALLVQSCLQGMQLGDNKEAMYLVEAHIFQEVRFDSHVKALRLEATTDQTIVANAQKFCDKWGFPLVRLG